MLRSIDLFTGIGGMTIGLHGIATPSLYCDIAPQSQAVIKHRIETGSLPAAPIMTDVRQVDCSNVKVDMICAGFPCVGFSVMGMQKAFANRESGLFHEVLRICDTCSPPLIFLENVSNVLRIGMPVIIDELSVKRGYELRWCLVSAESMGAPHVRSRWFCLAVRPGFTWAFESSKYTPYPWTQEVASSIVRTSPEVNEDRCGLLGNSVVPDAVRYAFLFLAGRNSEVVTKLDVNAGFAILPSQETKKMTKITQKVPRSGIVEAWSHDIIARGDPRAFRMSAVEGPVIDPESYRSAKPPSPLLKTPFIRKVVRMARWSTPRHSLTGPCNYLTERSIRDLPTQVRFEVNTIDRDNNVSPEFIEFMMGFPIGWTKLA